MLNLEYQVTTAPDFTGYRFYVPAGKLFDADNYAAWHGLHRTTLAAQDVRAVQAAAGRLNPGEWLEVLLVSN